jgi:hypothetical protein
MMVTFDRRACRLILSVLTPSMSTLPVISMHYAGLMRSDAQDEVMPRSLSLTRVDLPLPVLPTIPTFSPLLIVTSRLSRTVGPSSEYFADSLSSTISPEVGHDAGGSFSGTELGSWSITR